MYFAIVKDLLWEVFYFTAIYLHPYSLRTYVVVLEVRVVLFESVVQHGDGDARPGVAALPYRNHVQGDRLLLRVPVLEAAAFPRRITL